MLGGWTPPAKPQRSNVISIAAPGTRRLLTAAEIKAQPNQPYVVRELLPAEGVAAIYGETGSGKSFLAMDLCFSIAAGRADWFGMAVNQAPAIYVALEGRGGVSKRVTAWEMHNQQPVASPVRFMVDDFSILDTEVVQQLGADIVATLGTGAVVLVDTLNQSAPGADENSSKDMSGVLTNAKHLADSVRGLVVLVHHTGKDRAKGMRGHSSLLAAMDAVIEVTHSAGLRSWSVAKSRDDEASTKFDFRLAQYVVGTDQWGAERHELRRRSHVEPRGA
jgi:RecA-family ATPase